MLGDSGAGWWCPSIGGQGYTSRGGAEGRGDNDDEYSLYSHGSGSVSQMYEGGGGAVSAFGQVLNPVLAENGMQGHYGRPSAVCFLSFLLPLPYASASV